VGMEKKVKKLVEVSSGSSGAVTMFPKSITLNFDGVKPNRFMHRS
jgi:hypothetical protein